MLIPPIVSVDDHVMEPPDLWERWLPGEFRENGPRVVRLPWNGLEGYHPRDRLQPTASGPEVDWWVVEDSYEVMHNGSAAVGLDPAVVDGRPISYDEMRPGCYEVKARLEDMDLINVERSLCFPNVSRFCGQRFLWMKDKLAARACVEAYNNWMVEEWCGDSGGRLIPLCLIPLWDVHAAAAEVRRNATRGVRAVAFSELPSELGLASIHDREGYWLPFIEACAETETVICIHIGSSSTVASTSRDAPWCVNMSVLNFKSILAMVDWLLSGLLAKFPRLKLAYSESQIGWMPYVFERVDRVWRHGIAFAEIDPAITEPPSSYVADRVFGCFFEDDFGLESRYAIGVDQITFETDYPHQDSTWPSTTAYVEKAMAHLPEQEMYKILRGNALRMLQLPETLQTR